MEGNADKLVQQVWGCMKLNPVVLHCCTQPTGGQSSKAANGLDYVPQPHDDVTQWKPIRAGLPASVRPEGRRRKDELWLSDPQKHGESPRFQLQSLSPRADVVGDKILWWISNGEVGSNVRGAGNWGPKSELLGKLFYFFKADNKRHYNRF